MPVLKYQKKPIIVEVLRYLGNDNIGEVIDFVGEENIKWDWKGCLSSPLLKPIEICHKIRTLEGYMILSVGDVIIKGVNGEFYPCKPEIFEKTYNIVVGQ